MRVGEHPAVAHAGIPRHGTVRPAVHGVPRAGPHLKFGAVLLRLLRGTGLGLQSCGACAYGAKHRGSNAKAQACGKGPLADSSTPK